MPSDFRVWYDQLVKPPWTPPPWIIGTVWSLLYPLITLSFGFVLLQVVRRRFPVRVAIPFVINLVSNLLFMPLFGNLRNLWLSSLDIIVVWLTIPWAMWAIWPFARWVAVLQIPYFCWVTFAMTIMLWILAANA